MRKTKPNYIKEIELSFEERLKKNSKYSLRAHANYLKISPGILSQILNGKKVPSFDLASKMAPRLNLDPLGMKNFMNSVVNEQSKRDLKRRDPKVKNFSDRKLETSELDVNYYKYISEWYYVTILELTLIKGFQSSAKWISSQLEVSELEVKIAIDRMLELGLLKVVRGRLVKVHEHVRLQNMYTDTNSARKEKQKQIRQKAIEAIDSQDISKRSMTSMTMGIDPKHIPEAKKMIEEFNEKICKFFNNGEKHEVYVLEVGLFSLHK